MNQEKKGAQSSGLDVKTVETEKPGQATQTGHNDDSPGNKLDFLTTEFEVPPPWPERTSHKTAVVLVRQSVPSGGKNSKLAGIKRVLSICEVCFDTAFNPGASFLPALQSQQCLHLLL